MAAIDQYLRQILEATYGEEVRHSIHDAILQNYMDVSESVAQANAAADTAEQALADASTVVSQANQAVQNANTAVTNTNSAVAAANSAVTAANSAAQNANEKATLADQKATLADTAATNADEKATLADEKATLADTAASNADTKAQLADEKATLANTAATNANEKATLANTAAANADEKATLADTAASNADTKATLADTAASNANEKATLADTAASNANEKATLADTSAVRANQAAASAENMTGIVAPTYSTSGIYKVGQYAVYNGQLYRCIVEITTAEEWTAAHWTAVPLGNEVSDLKSAIGDVTGNRIIKMRTNMRVLNSEGVLSETPFVEKQGNNCALVECSEGDVFIINGTSGTSYRLWAFFDSTRKHLSMSTSNAIGNNTIIIAPQNSAYLAINDLSGAGVSYYNKLLQNRIAVVESDLESIHDDLSVDENAIDILNEKSASTIGILSIEPVGKWVNGYYIKTKGLDNIASSINTPNPSATWAYAIIPCVPYDVFTVTGNSGTNPEAVVFVDANYNVLARYGNAKYVRKVFQAPPEAAYVVVNCTVSTMSTIYRGIPSLKQYALNNLTINLTGVDNEMWSWWIYPQAISFNRVRDRLYWTYTTHDGYCGVACYDFTTKQITKTHLKKGQIDDHNAPAIICLEDGTIVIGYAEGHNLSANMHIRISETPECIERFEDDIIVPSSGLTAYCQFISYSGSLYMFYRNNDNNWAYRVSTDRGKTWSAETILITATMKYYCKFVPTSTDGVVRIVMYSNPTSGDSNIRQGFLHLDTLNVYNSDNATVLGNSKLAYTMFSVIVPTEQNLNLNRLLDVAVTEPQRPLILYCTFKNGNDGVYKIYDGGSITTVVISGTDFFPAYQLGASWIGTDRIFLIRGSGGKDFVEIWNYSNGTAALSETVYSEDRGAVPIRNFRPIVDVNGRASLWVRGFFNARDYTDYNTDAKLHLLN